MMVTCTIFQVISLKLLIGLKDVLRVISSVSKAEAPWEELGLF